MRLTVSNAQLRHHEQAEHVCKGVELWMNTRRVHPNYSQLPILYLEVFEGNVFDETHYVSGGAFEATFVFAGGHRVGADDTIVLI